MKAILTVSPGPAGAPDCLPLFPLLDRPFLQHAVEHLVARGVLDIHLVVGRHAAAVERAIGDGTRWGCGVAYHLTRDPAQAGRVVRAVAAAGRGPVLVGHAGLLPPLPADVAAGRPALFDAAGEWTGWAAADAADVAAAPPDDLRGFLAGRGVGRVETGRPLRLGTLADVLAAQRALLGREFPGVLSAVREVRPGVWVARTASVARSANLVAPVFVGDHTAVGARARVGPGAVVGADCLLDADSAVRDSTVLPATFVGPGVELDGVVADRGRLAHPRRPTWVAVDHHLLHGLRPAGGVASWAERAAAGGAFVLALPVLLAAAGWFRLTRPGPVFWPRRFVRTPARASEVAWRTRTAFTLAPPPPGEGRDGWVVPATRAALLTELLPGLLAVARGDLRLVGTPPRDADTLRRLCADLYPDLLAAPAGLVTDAALADRHLPADELLLTDILQAHTSTAVADWARLGRFLLRAVARSR